LTNVCCSFMWIICAGMDWVMNSSNCSVTSFVILLVCAGLCVLNYHCLCHCSYICLQFLIVTTYKVIYKASPCRALYAPRRLEGVCRLALRTMILWYNFVVHFEQNTAANTVSFVSTCRNLFSSSKVTALYSIEMAMGLINANPIIHEKKERRIRQAPVTTDENAAESIDQLEIFDILLNDFPYAPFGSLELNSILIIVI
jgi:hypothetical protein